MIQLTRVLAKQLRAVLRKSVLSGQSRSSPLPVVFRASSDGIRMRAQNPEVGVEFHLPGNQSADTLGLDHSALDDFAGTTSAPVTLELVGPNTVRARWEDGKVPQVKEYPATDVSRVPALDAPKSWTPQDPRLLQALADASETTATNNSRYALQLLQLRGKEGKIVATDGKQLLVQDGFSFPWTEEVLVPALPLFSTTLTSETDIAIGRTKAHICLRVGSWTIWLWIDTGSRYPKVDEVIPSLRGPVSNAQLSTQEAAFLAHTLPRLPLNGEEEKPITVDFNGHVSIRAKGEKGPITEVALPDSLVRGPSVRTSVPRQCLARALELGFREFIIVKPDSPVVCRDEHRTYVWMPLGKESALESSSDAVLITPTGDGEPRRPATKAKESSATALENNTTTSDLVSSSTNGHAVESPPKLIEEEQPSSASLSSPIEEAEALKLVLRDAYLRSGRLVASLRRNRRQSKLLTSTMSALRQLQNIA